MTEKNNEPNGISRNILAYSLLIFALLALTISAGAAILVNPENAILIVNIILPVISSWVGTILAFYFGKENFEVANQQVLEIVRQLTPEERATVSITSIMRRLTDIVYVKIQNDQYSKIGELRANFRGNVSRLPIVEAGFKPKYMLHESSIDKYLVALEGNEEDTLAEFINRQKEAGFEFSLNKGFIVVPEGITVAAAKRKMQEIPSCQDIFITKEGKPTEPLIGWVSNIRMVKFLDA